MTCKLSKMKGYYFLDFIDIIQAKIEKKKENCGQNTRKKYFITLFL